MAASLRPGEHYELLIDRRAAELTDRGREFLATITASFGGVWRYRRARGEIARQALAALHLYERDHPYLVRGGPVAIVGEYTGRGAKGRKWEHGLHRLIEAKQRTEL